MQRIIFVVGNSRSGTTMMGRVLGGHDEVFTFNELHFFEQLWQPTTEPEVLSDREALGLMTTLIAYQRDGYFASIKPWNYMDEARQALAEIGGEVTGPAVYSAFISYECAVTARRSAATRRRATCTTCRSC